MAAKTPPDWYETAHDLQGSLVRSLLLLTEYIEKHEQFTSSIVASEEEKKIMLQHAEADKYLAKLLEAFATQKGFDLSPEAFAKQNN